MKNDNNELIDSVKILVEARYGHVEAAGIEALLYALLAGTASDIDCDTRYDLQTGNRRVTFDVEYSGTRK